MIDKYEGKEKYKLENIFLDSVFFRRFNKVHKEFRSKFS